MDNVNNSFMHKNKKANLKKKVVFLLCVIVLFVLFVFGIPIIINELYKMNTGYLTLWGPEDVLGFYATILGALITIGSLIVTIYYSKKDTEKQLKFSISQSNAPFFIVCDVVDYNKYDRNKEEKIWTCEYVINNNENDQYVDLVLKNVGNGIAIKPFFSQLSSVLSESDDEQYVCQNDDMIITLNIKNIVSSNFWKKDKTSDKAKLTLNYENTIGVKLKQNVLINVTKKEGYNTVVVAFSNMSSQKICI